MIYLSYFGLKEPPFGITPDTSFFYACRSTQETLNVLLVAVENGEGFIKITGEVGTGKTLLCRKFLAALGDNWISAYIPNPNLEPRALLLALADELGVRIEHGLDQHHLIKALNLALMEFSQNRKRVVLLLDETQAMPLDTLETLRLLTNLETEKRKLMQVIMFGQPELDHRLEHHCIRQMRQRITFQHQLGTLTREETEHYLAHRLAIAAYQGDRVFSRAAARAIHRASGGVPRLINILANKAMMLAFGRGSRRVGWGDARAAAKDTPATFAQAPRWVWFALACFAGSGIGWMLLR